MAERRLPARRLEIPAGLVLTNAQIVQALEQLNARAERGEMFDAVQEPPHAFSVTVGVGAVLTPEEIVCALTRLNQAKAAGHADVTFSFVDSRMVKKGWLLLKDPRDGDQGGPLQLSVGGIRVREF